MTKIYIVVLLIFLSASSALTAGQSLKTFSKHQYVEGELLVKFKNSTSYSTKLGKISSKGLVTIKEYGVTKFFHVKVDEDASMDKKIAELENDPSVESVQPNYIYKAFTIPNDDIYPLMWGLNNTGQTISVVEIDDEYETNNPGSSGKDMRMEEAWDIQKGSSSVIIAVIDSGVNYNHEDLTNNMWTGATNHGYDFVDSDSDPMDTNGHGTHVAGTIAAEGNNSIGTVGVCWDAQIMAVRSLDGTGVGTSASIASGIEYAVTHGADIINMSLGSSVADPLIKAELDNAKDNDVLLVVAAGNDGNNIEYSYNAVYPAAYTMSNLITVAALDQSYKLADFSNYGKTTVDVGAPGTNIVSTINGERAKTSVGTSDWYLSGDDIFSVYSSETYNNIFAIPDINYLNSNSNVANGKEGLLYSTVADSSGYDVVLLGGVLAFNVPAVDTLVLYANGSDSFGGFASDDAQIALSDVQSGSNGLGLIPLEFDISKNCADSAEVAIGLYYNSGILSYTMSRRGGAVLDMYYFMCDIDQTDQYASYNGTSMATPHVAGLAGLIKAQNPDYTATDMVECITKSGQDTTALIGKTSTGKAVDAYAALTYITTPKSVTVSVSY